MTPPQVAQRTRVLVVGSSRVFEKIMGAVAAELDVDLEYLMSAQRGLQRATESSFDLVCIDRHLQDGDGMEVCAGIRKLPAYETVPVFLLATDVSSELTQQALSAGVTEVIERSGFSEIGHSIRQVIDMLCTRINGCVLYVEDSRSQAQVTIAMLEGLHLKVDHFCNAEEALVRIGEGDYDIVITDVVLDGAMSGVGLVREIRKSEDPAIARLPILGVSGQGDPARRLEILRQGANDFIVKPILEEEFRARVRNLVRSKQLFDQLLVQQSRLRDIAITDQLTGCYNRHYLFEMASQYIFNARRRVSPLSLIVIDLDHFKQINDNHGHETGDTVLAETGRLLRAMCRGEDLPARFGGEEFVVLLVDCPVHHAVKKAEILRRKLEELRPAGLDVTASIGVATLPDDPDTDFKAMFRLADEAMYAAKTSGRNRVISADDLSSDGAVSAVS